MTTYSDPDRPTLRTIAERLDEEAIGAAEENNPMYAKELCEAAQALEDRHYARLNRADNPTSGYHHPSTIPQWAKDRLEAAVRVRNSLMLELSTAPPGTAHHRLVVTLLNEFKGVGL